MRELALVEELLARYMPRNVVLAHSAEIAAVGRKNSLECDIVVHDPDVPPLIESSVYRVLPAESVYGVIEVRSRLDKAGLRKAFRTITDVQETAQGCGRVSAQCHQFHTLRQIDTGLSDSGIRIRV